VLNELQERVYEPEETDDLLRLGLHRLPAKEFPRLRSLAGELAAYDGLQELEEGLDVVLGGLRRQLEGRRRAGGTPPADRVNGVGGPGTDRGAGEL
jgi:hypothetical protein